MFHSHQHYLLSVLLIFIYAQNVIHSQSVSVCRVHNFTNMMYAYESDENKTIQPDEDVENSQTIIYKCNPGYILKGPTRNVCINGSWFGDHPKCLIRECPSATIRSVSFESICEFNGEEISCDEPIRPGTKVNISCNSGYQWPKRKIKDTLTCGDDGKWDFRPVRCEAICGTESSEAIPFLLGGEKINNSLIPWHVLIYKRQNQNYDHACAGTILSERIVLSAAHCFWNFNTKKQLDKSLFVVAAGKYYREFESREPQFPQFFNISVIHISSNYLDATAYYQNNVAIIVVNGFIEFKSYIKPICIEWLNYKERSIKSDLIGRVAGWGIKNDGTRRSELRIIELLTVSQEDCINAIASHFRPYVAGNTFCAKAGQNGSICLGETAGGYSISKIRDDTEIYFLQGFVNLAVTKNTKCNGNNSLLILTNIHHYSSMIIENIKKYRLK